MRAIVVLCFGAFLSLSGLVQAAESLPVGQSIVLDDTITVAVRPSTPFDANGKRCDIQQGGTLRLEQMQQDFGPRYNPLKLVPHVAATYTPPQFIPADKRRDNPCQANAQVWVETMAVRRILDRERQARERKIR